MTAIRWSVFTFFVPLAIWAQAERPQFEVATVKPAPPIVAGPEVNIGIRIDGVQFTDRKSVV